MDIPIESSTAAGWRSATRSSSSRSRRKYGRAPSGLPVSGGSVIRPTSSIPAVSATSSANASHASGAAPFRGPTRETGERPSGREGLHHVGEIGDAVGRVALERPDEVPRCLGQGGALGAKLLHVVLTELAHPGLPGPANDLRRDRL